MTHELDEEVEVLGPGPANSDLPTAHRARNVAGSCRVPRVHCCP
jgi:hypothetical protein